MKKPKIDPTGQVIENQGTWTNRLCIGTPTTGTCRVEWVSARYGQILPTNWSMFEVKPWITTVMPLRYLVAEAQNIIVQRAVEQKAEWLLLIEQDNVLPIDAFVKFNQYMIKGDIPVISGLYFTKSVPPEPMIYMGPGKGYYDKWKMGDKVWAWGVPTGSLLIHMSIIKKVWEESPEYNAGGLMVRRVFETPAKVWFDETTGNMRSETGTSDLAWCDRVIKGKFFEKAGWPKYQKMKYPFLCDTSIFVKHIDDQGRQWPLEVPKQYLGEVKKRKI